MNFEIVTDSSCNLTEEMIDDLGEKTDLKQFYTMMREGKVFTTSLPNMADAEALFRSLLEAGKDVLYLGFSSALSGTHEAVRMLCMQLASEYPERTVRAVGTLAASGGQGLLVYHACMKAREGATLEETARWVEESRLHLAHWFTVDDLMFLLRGGRVSKVSAYMGTMLNIKPVMHVDDEGRLIPMEKVRGRKKALQALVKHMEDSAWKPVADQPVFITHGDCIEDVEYVSDLIREKFGDVKITVNYVDPVIGAHSGPGTLALFFLADQR